MNNQSTPNEQGKDSNFFDKLQSDANKIEKKLNENSFENDTIFLIRTANQCIDEASKRPIPNMLFSEFWHESELSIFFAGAGIGKTILGVQIGNSISKGTNIKGFKNQSQKQKVLYFDFELSDKQFEKRYSNNYSNHYIFDDDFFRIEIDPEAEDFSEKMLFESIEKTIEHTNSKILIIDNLTYLGTNLETSKDALPLMKHLKKLKKKYELSMLVLAHTPKRDFSKPITLNDLAGSSQLGNFADSIFTINQSSNDKSLRYIKQIKARATEKIYDADNVVICEIKNKDNFTCLDFFDFGKETDHLKAVKDFEKSELETAIIELKKNNPEKSLRQIAEMLYDDYGKVNQMRVKRTLDKEKKRLEKEALDKAKIN